MKGAADQPENSGSPIEQIDRICDDFEAGLRRGNSHSIRSRLNEVDEEHRPELFRHLLGIQQSILRSESGNPGIQELLAEYPEYAKEIMHSFSGSCFIDTITRSSDRLAGEFGIEAILEEVRSGWDFRIGAEFARGGMGALNLAEDPALRRRIAVKTMLTGRATAEEVCRFVEEAQITGQLDHPGIVPVHELGVNRSGEPYYAMKFVHGRDLHAILEGLRNGDEGTLKEYSLHRLLTVFNRVCDAVAFAHAHGVIHRDLKPANIRVGEFGEVLVMDWGLAKLVRDHEVEAESTTETRQIRSIRDEEGSGEFHTIAGSIMGSPQYMAPEQAAGETEKVGPATDIYALGAILYEILTLSPAIALKGDVYTILDSVTSGTIRSPLRLNRAPQKIRNRKLPHCPGHRIPEALGIVATKALSLEPDDRYASVGDLQDDVEAWMGGFATEAENAGLWRQIRLFVRRNKVASAAAAIVMVAVCGAAGIYVKGEWEKAEQARKSAPAYVKSALALEQKGDFESALAAVEGALAFDPMLANGHRVRAILLARSGELVEALAAAETWTRLAPGNEEARELQNLLSEDPTGSDASFFPKLADLATRAEMPNTATDFLAQSAIAHEELYREMLPVWQARLDQAWPGLPEVNHLQIDSKLGLKLHLADSVESSLLTSLEPLRGIPLASLYIGNLKQLSGLSPLKGMPLRSLSSFSVPIGSIEALRNCPLDTLSLRAVYGPFSREFLEPLRGKKLDFLVLGPNQTDTSPLAAVQVRQLTLTGSISSLGFLRNQENLRVLNLANPPDDQDCSPLLGLPTLEPLSPETAAHLNAGLLMPIWKDLNEADPDSALERVKTFREQAVSPGVGEARRSLDLMRFLIERKLNGRSKVDPAILGAVRVGSKVYVYLPFSPQPLAGQETVNQALATLDVSLASIHSEEENNAAIEANRKSKKALIGAYRQGEDSTWRWRDQSSWDFCRLPKANEDRVRQEFDAQELCFLINDGVWTSSQRDRFYIALLIQFPAEWLGGD